MRSINYKKIFALIFILLIGCFLIVGCSYKKPILNEKSKHLEDSQTRGQVVKESNLPQGQEEKVVKQAINPVGSGGNSNTKNTDEILKAEDNKANQVKSVKSQDAELISHVTISIVGNEDTGVILEPTLIEISDADTVLDVLIKATKDTGIPMAFRGRKSTAYIEGIDNLYEFDYGPKSGWLYNVNGDFYSKSAGALEVKANDVIEWLYTMDMGKDIGASLSTLGQDGNE